MKTRLPMVLEDLRIATPCSADWDEMSGDERVRFCGSCEKNVYDLSAMTRAEAEALVREREGRMCVRFFQRRDGTVITSDCPVAVERQRLHRRMWAKVAGVAASAALVLGVFGGRARGDLTIRDGKKGTPSEPVRVMMGAPPVAPEPRRQGGLEVKPQPPTKWMGKMALPHKPAAKPVHAVEKKGEPMPLLGSIAAPRKK